MIQKLEEIKELVKSRTAVIDHYKIYLWDIKKRFSPDYVKREDMEKLYQKVGIIVNKEKKYENISQIRLRVKDEMKKKIKELAFSESVDNELVKIIKQWCDQLPNKAPKKEKILEYFNNVSEFSEEPLIVKNKKLVRFVIEVVNEVYNGEVKTIEEFRKYVMRVIKTSNHFTYKKDKVIVESKDEKLMRKLEAVIKIGNEKKLKKLLNVRDEVSIREKHGKK